VLTHQNTAIATAAIVLANRFFADERLFIIADAPLTKSIMAFSAIS
jgi:hypothetical protein